MWKNFRKSRKSLVPRNGPSYRNLIVDIFISVLIFPWDASGRNCLTEAVNPKFVCFQPLDSYFCAPVRWFGHFSCVIFCTFVTFLVHFCPQVQQFGHFCNFPAVTFFCAFACCTSIFVDRREGLTTFSILHQFFYNLAIFDPWASQTAAPVDKSGWSTKLPKTMSL